MNKKILLSVMVAFAAILATAGAASTGAGITTRQQAQLTKWSNIYNCKTSAYDAISPGTMDAANSQLQTEITAGSWKGSAADVRAYNQLAATIAFHDHSWKTYRATYQSCMAG